MRLMIVCLAAALAATTLPATPVAAQSGEQATAAPSTRRSELARQYLNLIMTDQSLGFGVRRLLAGVTFSLGLILVVVAGAELFTGNNLIVMAWADGKVSTRALLRNWTLVYLANFAGALGRTRRCMT